MEFTLESVFSAGAGVGHLSYALLIISMLMTRIAWLRIFAIGSGIVAIAYDYFWLLDPVGVFWETAFVLTNVAQLGILAYRNRMATFTAEERAFYEMALPNLEPVQMRRLLKYGRWMDAAPGTVLIRQGKPVADLVFIVSGLVDIDVDDRRVGHCGPGSLIGEIGVSTGGPASATAVVAEPVRFIAFEARGLRQLLDRGDDIGRAVEAAFRHSLREKLLRANEAMVASPAGSGV